MKHGIADNAVNYPFCSAKLFYSSTDEYFRAVLPSSDLDRVMIEDDF